MLVVNPMHRITIEDIRKHPWFKRNLPDYLQPPREEFFDTGVDVRKLPPLNSLERGSTGSLRGGLHDAVVDKLGSTMGYAKDDVQDALTRAEPSAIKDAYMIVRENTMMIPKLRDNDNPGFTAQSPPAWDSFLTISGGSSGAPPRTSSSSRTSSPPIAAFTSPEEDNIPTPSPFQSPSSNIGILQSSLPVMHRAFMLGPQAPPPAPPASTSLPTPRSLEGTRITTINPTPLAGRSRARPIKWQFGIRSRNAPLEAMGCIYRALGKLGAEWTEQIEEPGDLHHSGDSSPDPYYSDSDSDHERRGGHRHHNDHHSQARLPKDPWIIHARWKKYAPAVGSDDGQPGSTTTPTFPTEGVEESGRDEDYVYIHLAIQLYQVEIDNFLVDFKCAGYERLPLNPSQSPPSVPTTPPVAAHIHSNSTPSTAPPSGTTTPIEGGIKKPKVKKRVGFLETLGGEAEEGEKVREEGETERRGGAEAVRAGTRREERKGEEEKDVNSPFPFLDVAGRLICQLAEAGGE